MVQGKSDEQLIETVRGFRDFVNNFANYVIDGESTSENSDPA